MRTRTAPWDYESRAISYTQFNYSSRRTELLAERDAILDEIMPYFTYEMWCKWVDAGPDSLTDFIKYAQAELQNILNEMFEDERVTA